MSRTLRSAAIVCALGVATSGLGVPGDQWPVRFTDVAAQAGLTHPSVQAPSNRLYHNRRDGTFVDVTDQVGLRRTGWASGICAGDYDADGWLDVLITFYGQNVLYRSDNGRRFQDVTS